MKRILVTGSSRGIGKAVALRLAQDGFAVVTHAVKNADDEGKASLVERMDVLHAPHVCEAAQQLGLGSMEYEIVEV